MFDGLKGGLSSFLSGLRGKPILDAKEIATSLQEIRLILLEADVALPVVKSFLLHIQESAEQNTKIKGVTTGQQLIKIVSDALVAVLSPNDNENYELNLKNKAPNVILMLGLQGSGKTTSSAKIAYLLNNRQKKRVLLASLDTIRPAAQEQLAILAKEISVDSLSIVKGQKPIDITKRAMNEAKKGHYDVLILDSAGRTTIDQDQMQDLVKIEKISKPHEKLLVVDAMTGQDAFLTASHFKESINITGTMLTRIDGDQRGGVAISLRAVTGVPIKFLGTGEKIDAVELFDAQRIANRIFDKGDIVALVEEAKDKIDQKESAKMAKKLAKGRFDLDDLAAQFKAMRKMGGISKLASMMPGMGSIKSQIDNMGDDGEKKIIHSEAIISSMTRQERKLPKLLNASRKRRIAGGCGCHVSEINRLLKSHRQMADMMKKMKNKRSMSQLFGSMGVDESELAQLENFDAQTVSGLDNQVMLEVISENKDVLGDLDLSSLQNSSKNNLLPGLGMAQNNSNKNINKLPGLDILFNKSNNFVKKK